MITQHEAHTGPVKALTWKQPYAELMLHGKLETRTWATPYRGIVLLCAGVNAYSLKHLEQVAGSLELLNDIMNTHNAWLGHEHIGHAFAVGRLVDCRPMQKEDEPKAWVGYRNGLYVHEYQDVTPIKPFPWRGALGWRTLTEDQRRLITLQS